MCVNPVKKIRNKPKVRTAWDKSTVKMIVLRFNRSESTPANGVTITWGKKIRNVANDR